MSERGLAPHSLFLLPNYSWTLSPPLPQASDPTQYFLMILLTQNSFPCPYFLKSKAELPKVVWVSDPLRSCAAFYVTFPY